MAPRVHRTAVVCSDVDLSLRFYRDFDGGAEPAPKDRPPANGFFLVSLYVDVESTLARLEAFGVEPEGETEVPSPNGQVLMATVRDPDGVLVELIGVPG